MDSSYHSDHNTGESAEGAEEPLSTWTDRANLDESQLLLGTRSDSVSLLHLHPEPVQIFKLWQKFLDNVDPLVKLCHVPTVQQQILQATGNLESVPTPVEALMFSIYSIAVVSLENDECYSITGESKRTLLHRYRLGVEHALINAEFIKSSDLNVLRAFILYLVSNARSPSYAGFRSTDLPNRLAGAGILNRRPCGRLPGWRFESANVLAFTGTEQLLVCQYLRQKCGAVYGGR